MCRSDLQAITLRSLHFEIVEARLVLSAQPVSELQAGRGDDSDQPLVLADIHASTGVRHAQRDLGLTGYGQTVAVIDSGIAYDHAALGGGFGTGYRIVGGWDFAEDDADPFDDAPAGLHGTHIAGIIGSQHVEHLGVAPNVDLVALRVFDDQGSSDFEWVEGALQWVDDHQDDFPHPITTVNLSLGAGWSGKDLPGWATLEDEFARLRRSGIFVSVAAGNNFEGDGTAGLDYPAASPHVVPVASYGRDDSLSPFSRRSDRVLVAPGEDITSTATDFLYDFNGITDDFYSASGTSMAAAYVSGVSVLVRQAMEAAGWWEISHDSIYGLLRDTAQRVYDPATQSYYHHIDVQAALDSIMPSPIHDLGELALQQTIELSASTDGVWYRFTPARSGVLTLETLRGHHGQVNLEMFDANREPLAGDGQTPNRVDTNVRAGQSLFVRLQGDNENESVPIRFTNLVSVVGQTLDVIGTPHADDFQLDLGVGHWLTVNGVKYDLPSGTGSTTRIHGGGGEDSLRIDGTENDEHVWLGPQTVRVQSAGLLVEADGTHRNYVCSGGGDDRAYLDDSESNDTFHGRPEYSLMEGPGYFNYVEGFQRVRAYSKQGGEDNARLYDSAGDDVYLGDPDHSELKGEAFVNYAFGFDVVEVRASRGGYDRAELHGAPTDDIFTSRASLKTLLGVNYHHQVYDFEVNHVYSGDGGWDRAVFNELGARDAVYQQPSLPSSLDTIDAMVHGFPVIDVHQGDRTIETSGDLAVDYLLQDDATWL